jgi:hypothetical protein
MPALNSKQIVLIVVAMLSFLASASANLTDLFGPGLAKIIVSTATFLNGLISASLAPFLSNTNVVLDAKDQTGVSVNIDRYANQKLAALAIDPTQANISPAPGEAAAVSKVAEGTNP